MDLIHATVQHQTFGQGEITHQDEEMISVSFPKPYGKKKFLFPGAFGDHLALTDEALLAEMNEILQQKHIQVVAEQVRVERSERIARYLTDSAEKATRAKAASKKKKK